MPFVTKPLITALILGATVVAAGAQSVDGTRNTAPDKTLPGDGATRPQQQQPSGSSQAPDSLSDQLRRSGGVLTPPNEGASRTPVIPPPNEGSTSMPVIPPPGTPGGNPGVQPK